MANVRDWLFEKGPRWVRGVLGSKLATGAIGLVADQLGDAASSAVKSPWLTLSTQPDDALDELGPERNIDRYAGESATTFRQRLLAAWESWTFAGTESGIPAQFEAFGLPNVTVEPANPGDPVACSHIRVIIATPHPYDISPRWGTMTWGSFNWGVTPNDIGALVGIVRKWKAGHEKLVEIVILTTGASFWGSITWGSFTWGGNPPPIILQVS